MACPRWLLFSDEKFSGLLEAEGESPLHNENIHLPSGVIETPRFKLNVVPPSCGASHVG